MILIERNDGYAINLSSATSLNPVEEGIVVEFASSGDHQYNFYLLTDIKSVKDLQDKVTEYKYERHYYHEPSTDPLIVIEGQFEGWPKNR